jgi:hypothetical protein
MTLKDSSAYNIQFYNGKPILIDTLSFERYREGMPWIAYRQVCQHFLAPLALMCLKDVRMNQLLRIYIDGIPLDLASRILPLKSRLKFPLLTHIHFHAKSQEKYAAKSVQKEGRKMPRISLLGLIDNLEGAIKRLSLTLPRTEWGEYYGATNYTSVAMEHKQVLVKEFLIDSRPSTVWDLGANTGEFSLLASAAGIFTVSFDIDPVAVELNYRQMTERKDGNLLPLLLDLTNPSPGIGWENRERMSLEERGPADTVLALALVHHLAISNNLPLDRVADFLARTCNNLIIEFVPKSDSQVQRLLSTREDIFPDYTPPGFENAFSKYFKILKSAQIHESERILYSMEQL